MGRRYVQRIDVLRAAPTVAELYERRALRFHALTGDRAGQYAINLTGRIRLIVTVGDERSVTVYGVEDYHG